MICCFKCGSNNLIICTTISSGTIYTVCRDCGTKDIKNKRLYAEFKQKIKELKQKGEL